MGEIKTKDKYTRDFDMSLKTGFYIDCLILTQQLEFR